jgi:hypothetical protein
MPAVLSNETLQDEIAVSVAQVLVRLFFFAFLLFI